MSTTITGKLNKAANKFQAGESTGFGIRLGVKTRNPKTKEAEWCNYSATIFAKSQGQVLFYEQALVEGTVIEISCETLLIESYEGNSGVQLSINMINSKLGFVHTGQQVNMNQAPQQQQAPQQGFQQQAPQQGYQQQAVVQAPQQQAYPSHGNVPTDNNW